MDKNRIGSHCAYSTYHLRNVRSHRSSQENSIKQQTVSEQFCACIRMKGPRSVAYYISYTHLHMKGECMLHCCFAPREYQQVIVATISPGYLS